MDGERLRPGQVYLAPPDRHLLIEEGILRVTRGPKENFSRPAIDPLFRSAAREVGPRVTAVILSGTLYDATAGLAAVKKQGGFTIVQDPSEAALSEMPENAIAAVEVDRILRLNDIAEYLTKRAHGLEIAELQNAGEGKIDMTPETPETVTIDALSEVTQKNRDEQVHGERNGHTTVYTCPECGGTLWQAGGGSFAHFRCHVGHAFSGESLAIQLGDNVERSLWFAVRTLVDRSVLLRQLAENARKLGNQSSAQHFEREARTAGEHAATVQQLIENPAETNRDFA